MADTIWGRIEQLMLARNWHVSNLATASGVGQSTIWKWEHGHQDPARESLRKVADALGVSVDQLEGRLPLPKKQISAGPTFSKNELKVITVYRANEQARTLIDAIVKQFPMEKT